MKPLITSALCCALAVCAVDCAKVNESLPSVIASKDSLCFRIPVREADGVWVRNRLPAGTPEYEWVFDAPVKRNAGF